MSDRQDFMDASGKVSAGFPTSTPIAVGRVAETAAVRAFLPNRRKRIHRFAGKRHRPFLQLHDQYS